MGLLHEKVAKANNVFQCLFLSIPGCLETPLTSKLWKFPSMSHLLPDKRLNCVKVHTCMYGV